jgi:two-component system sensor histidine kinase KdpD
MVGLAQIESNAMHLRKNWTTVQDVVNTSIERSKNKLDSYSIRIEQDRELPAILVDAASISEVLYLLLDNAAKYSPKGSKIRIAAHQIPESMIEISVDDQGQGIPIEYREKVFQKFVRLPESRVPSTREGMGLGLAIVKGIIESQGGHIRIENGTDEFVTRFTISLPIEDQEKNGK